jgi:hypothetical protein
VFGLPRMKGPRLTVWRSSFAHPRSTHIQTVHTHWLNYKVRIRSCDLPPSSFSFFFFAFICARCQTALCIEVHRFILIFILLRFNLFGRLRSCARRWFPTQLTARARRSERSPRSATPLRPGATPGARSRATGTASTPGPRRTMATIPSSTCSGVSWWTFFIPTSSPGALCPSAPPCRQSLTKNKLGRAAVHIGRYMKTGLFTAISVGTGIDRHNVAAIVPLGRGPVTVFSSVAAEGFADSSLSLSLLFSCRRRG